MNIVTLKQIAKGLLSHVPGLVRPRWHGESGSATARYCYAVWMRHMVMAWEQGFQRIPATVAELGPGRSLGTGLAAVLSGADTYFALDVVPFADAEKNLAVLEELLKLFRRREPVPGLDEYPNVYPRLKAYGFPGHILTDAHLARTLSDDRLQAVRRAVRGEGQTGGPITVAYQAPWHDAAVIRPESADMVFSQAVFQYVDPLDPAYEAMRRWLKSDGFISHQIAFDSHGLAAGWNGHWAYPAWMWQVIRGRRPGFISRRPYCDHREALRRWGFRIVGEVLVRQPLAVPRDRLARPYRDLPEAELTIAGAFVQAVKGPLP
jgi:hypothetical protein